jgi:5-methylcytosine-specific restriction endonuclease McrA
MKRHRRHSRHVTNDRRWPALRLEVLRRDSWTCRQCGGPGREVDHIKPVRDRPDLAFAVANLQTLCRACHTRKTRREVGLPEPSPERQRWAAAIASTGKES